MAEIRQNWFLKIRDNTQTYFWHLNQNLTKTIIITTKIFSLIVGVRVDSPQSNYNRMLSNIVSASFNFPSIVVAFVFESQPAYFRVPPHLSIIITIVVDVIFTFLPWIIVLLYEKLDPIWPSRRFAFLFRDQPWKLCRQWAAIVCLQTAFQPLLAPFTNIFVYLIQPEELPGQRKERERNWDEQMIINCWMFWLISFFCVYLYICVYSCIISFLIFKYQIIRYDWLFRIKSLIEARKIHH
jgi:hypothetical protein